MFKFVSIEFGFFTTNSFEKEVANLFKKVKEIEHREELKQKKSTSRGCNKIVGLLDDY